MKLTGANQQCTQDVFIQMAVAILRAVMGWTMKLWGWLAKTWMQRQRGPLRWWRVDGTLLLRDHEQEMHP